MANYESSVAEQPFSEDRVETETLEYKEPLAQETVSMEKDVPSESQEINAERSEIDGVRPTDVGLLIESRESVAARGKVLKFGSPPVDHDKTEVLYNEHIEMAFEK